MPRVTDLKALERRHLDWSNKQAHILTGGGKAEEYYTGERGFSFSPQELPHHYVTKKTTHNVFHEWRSSKDPCTLITGAWNRPLFTGGWKHSTSEDETVFNIQTRNLFIDMRIPKSRNQLLKSESISSLEDLSPLQLRLYARQHIFAGFSAFEHENGRPVCTRHHCIDWNFVGAPRTRPNKWWIEMSEDSTKWKELSYSTDENGQHYYFERWELLEEASEPRLALRKVSSNERDGVLVIVGDHFNYVLAREFQGDENKYPQKTLVGLVDAAVEAGDLTTARSYLSIEGGHGRVSKDWTLDCSIPPWNEGTQLWGEGDVRVDGEAIEGCQVKWKDDMWDVLDCSFDSVRELEEFLSFSPKKMKHCRL
jgi:hypothetical protein